MTNILELTTRPLTSAHDLEVLLPPTREALLLGLAGKLQRCLCAADENLGHLEEHLLRGGHELFRQMLEKAAQQKADAAPPLCPHCQNKLSRPERRSLDHHPNPLWLHPGPTCPWLLSASTTK